MPESSRKRPRIVVLGAGFAGLTATMRLAREPVDVTVIDRHNYHLFQPLLYQVATAALSPADIAAPIRGILAKLPNVSVLLDTITDIDRQAREVHTLSGRSIDYDYLVVATGATHNYFGNDHWQKIAPGLKRIEDATELRRRILLAFERAEMEEDPDRRKALMTFVIVGGGPTGVEMAGAVAELTRFTLARDFRRIKPENARVLLVDANDRVLRPFPEKLSKKACKSLERMGVQAGAQFPGGRHGRKLRAHRRRDHPHRDGDLERRRQGLAGRRLAGCRDRPVGPHRGRRTSAPARRRTRFRPRRRGRAHQSRRHAHPGAGTGGQAAGPLCRARAGRAVRRKGAAGSRFATATTASWPPSAAIRRWSTCVAGAFRAGRAGGSGAWPTSIT